MSKTSSPPRTTIWPSDSIDFSPGLAAKLDNLNEAVVLSTVHAQLQKSKNVRDGHRWVFHPLTTWQESFFPWWSLPTVERTFKSLKESGLLIAASEYNARKGDRTLWYRIDYTKLGELTKDLTPTRPPRKASKARVNDSRTGYIIDLSGVSTPASPKVDVKPKHATGGTQQVPPPTSTPTNTPEPETVSAPAPQHEHEQPKVSLEQRLKAHGLAWPRVFSAMLAALKTREHGRVAVFRHMRMNGVEVPFDLQQPVIDAYNASGVLPRVP